MGYRNCRIFQSWGALLGSSNNVCLSLLFKNIIRLGRHLSIHNLLCPPPRAQLCHNMEHSGWKNGDYLFLSHRAPRMTWGHNDMKLKSGDQILLLGRITCRQCRTEPRHAAHRFGGNCLTGWTGPPGAPWLAHRPDVPHPCCISKCVALKITQYYLLFFSTMKHWVAVGISCPSQSHSIVVKPTSHLRSAPKPTFSWAVEFLRNSIQCCVSLQGWSQLPPAPVSMTSGQRWWVLQPINIWRELHWQKQGVSGTWNIFSPLKQ